MENIIAGIEKIRQVTAKYLSVALSLYFIVVIFYGMSATITERNVFLTSCLVILFLHKGLTAGKIPYFIRLAIDLALIAAAIYIGFYTESNYIKMVMQMGIANYEDIFVGTIFLILIVEAARRVVSVVFLLIAIIFFIYAYYGDLIPGLLGHRGYSFERIISMLYTTENGIYGLPLDVMVTYIFPFIIFGSFVQLLGGGEFFLKLSQALFKGSPASSAYASVLGSSMVGTVTGSAAANVVTTGTVTIPLMKKVGFPGKVAGAIETSASSGGQFTPPVMGSGVFLMAGILAIPYVTIATKSLLPAVLFYLYLFLCIYLLTKKLNIRRVEQEVKERVWKVTLEGLPTLLSFAVLIFMVFSGYAPRFAAAVCIVLFLLLTFIHPKHKVGLKDIRDGLAEAPISSMGTTFAIALAGVIYGSVLLTGIGLKFGSLLIAAAGSNLLLILLITSIAAIILGMGLPTSIVYILLALLIGPTLVDIIGNPLAAHLYFYYYGALSAITPPVAIAAFAAAPIAKDSAFGIGLTSMRLSLAAFIIPIIFVYNPAILLEGGMWDIVVSVLLITAGFCMLAVGSEGYLWKSLSWIERALFLILALIVFIGICNHQYVLSLGSVVAAIIAAVMMMMAKKKQGVREFNSPM